MRLRSAVEHASRLSSTALRRLCGAEGMLCGRMQPAGAAADGALSAGGTRDGQGVHEIRSVTGLVRPLLAGHTARALGTTRRDPSGSRHSRWCIGLCSVFYGQ
jgi:hypothetical protein